jgi:hypothetical protein
MALLTSPAARHQLRNLLTAFSLGTMCFIRRWYDLENLQARGLDYFRVAPADFTLLTSTVVSALLLSAVFWLAWLWVERHSTPARRRFGQCVFLLILMFPIESVRRYWNTVTERFDIGSNLSLWVVETLLACGFVLLLAGNTRILYPARKTALWLTLLFPALMIDFAMTHVRGEMPEAYLPRPPAVMLAPHASSSRVIWLIFDEFDQRLAFDRRPTDVRLPELDRLRSESLTADHATQVSLYTAIALPSLISGRVFTNAQAVDADELRVLREGSSQYVEWNSESNVFTQAHGLGVNSALVGWHHPYCRIIGDQLVHCFALPSTHSTAALAQEAHAAEDGVWRTIPQLFQRQAYNLADMLHSREEPASERLRDSEVQRDQQQQYFRIRDEAYRQAADPRVGLLFVHLPTPHPFPIYNRRKASFELSGTLDYFDNLALVDRTIGELRRTLEQAGLWERTSLLVTGDHGLRAPSWAGHLGWTSELDQLTGRQNPVNVPFILKIGGSAQPAAMARSFSNVVSADMVLAVLRGEISTSTQAAAWLEQHGPAASSTMSAISAEISK